MIFSQSMEHKCLIVWHILISIYFFCFSFLQESPRWLLMSGQPAKARVALEKILRFNKKDVSALDELPSSTKQPQTGKSAGGGLIAMMKNSTLRKTVLALFSLW